MDPERETSFYQFTVSAGDVGSRLDRTVAAHCPGLSRTRVQELLAAALILVNGQKAKGSYRLRGGERITVEAPERPPLRGQPEIIPLEVLYEDEELMAINKPAGMVVHAGAGQTHGTLVNALLGRGQALSQRGDALRPGIIHRLDKDTSGIILVAKNDVAHAKLGEAFRQRTIQKTYITLVQGVLDQSHGRIDLAIGRDPRRRVRMTARGSAVLAKARAARTDWRVLARVDATTLAEVQLHTGRTHQIRVHFSTLRHPVVGDTLYGAASQLRVGKVTLPSLGRHFLHAAKLRFSHPRSGAWLELRAPLPPELYSFLHQLTEASGQDGGQIDAALASYL